MHTHTHAYAHAHTHAHTHTYIHYCYHFRSFVNVYSVCTFIIPQMRMLDSDWLVSHVVLFTPHGWQLIPHGRQTAGGLKRLPCLVFGLGAKFFLLYRKNYTSDNKDTYIFGICGKNYIDFTYHI